MVAVRPSMAVAEQYFSCDRATARSTAAISADPYRQDSMGRVVRQEYSQERITRTGAGAGRIAPVDQ
jgi:hypothetical protein